MNTPALKTGETFWPWNYTCTSQDRERTIGTCNPVYVLVHIVIEIYQSLFSDRKSVYFNGSSVPRVAG